MRETTLLYFYIYKFTNDWRIRDEVLFIHLLKRTNNITINMQLWIYCFYWIIWVGLAWIVIWTYPSTPEWKHNTLYTLTLINILVKLFKQVKWNTVESGAKFVQRHGTYLLCYNTGKPTEGTFHSFMPILHQTLYTTPSMLPFVDGQIVFPCRLRSG